MFGCELDSHGMNIKVMISSFQVLEACMCIPAMSDERELTVHIFKAEPLHFN